MLTKNIFKQNLLKALSVLAVASLSLGFSTAVQADIKFKPAAKNKSQQKHKHYDRYERERVRRGNARHSNRGRYGQKHYDYSRDRHYDKNHRRHYDGCGHRYHNGRYDSRYDRRYDRRYNRHWNQGHYNSRYDRGYYRRPVLTNCRYVYNRYGERTKRCYPARYRYDVHDNGYYHGRRFHDRYGVYYNSYRNGRYQRRHRGHHRSGYYYDTRAGEWIALAILFDRLLDH